VAAKIVFQTAVALGTPSADLTDHGEAGESRSPAKKSEKEKKREIIREGIDVKDFLNQESNTDSRRSPEHLPQTEVATPPPYTDRGGHEIHPSGSRETAEKLR
jgi:hypothetical protein